MLKRTFFLGGLIVLLGYGALYFLQWQMGLGDFAKGPQTVTLLRYERSVVAGGRAGVEYLGREGPELSFLLHCLEGSETVSRSVRLKGDEKSPKTCDVYLRVLETKNSDAYAVKIEVSWDKK